MIGMIGQLNSKAFLTVKASLESKRRVQRIGDVIF